MFAQHGDRRISRRELDRQIFTLVDRYRGKRINSPNDLVFSPSGELYFTDPPFGLPKTFADPGKELAFQGVYRLGRDGRLTLLTDELSAPNGIAFAPDGTLLGWVDFGGNVGNVAWGEDGGTLFIAANATVYRVRLSTRGAGWPAAQAQR